MSQLYKLFFIGNKCIIFIYFLIVFSFSFHAQNSYTFNPCGASGRFGPNQSQVNSAYAGTNLNGLVSTTSSTSGIQSFTIPPGVNKITIEAAGAEGGPVLPKLGGRGASMKGTFDVSPGQVLNIVVGQMGLAQATNNCNGGGGGGGTFVYVAGSAQPMIVAGGGGGGHLYLGPGCSGTVSTNACTSASSNGAPGNAGAGGASGACGSGWPGAGGAGWLGAGGNTCIWSSQLSEGGYSQFSWLGGKRNPTAMQGTQSQDGSFGGGGAAFHGAGGGGGYSGGGGGGSCYTDEKPLGGGGGSYNAGTNQFNYSGINSGHGKVIISVLLLSLSINQTAAIQCYGQLTGALTASVNGGTGPYTYSWSPSGGTSFTAVNLGAGVYTVQVKDLNNISVFSSYTLTQPAPITGAASSNTICNGSTVTLSGSGATTYTWTGGVINGVGFTPSATNSYTMTGTNTLTGCTSTVAVTVAVVPCTGMNEHAGIFKELKVYPNPVDEEFTIETKDGSVKTITIFDYTGKIVFTSEGFKNIIHINLGFLANGFYTIKIQNDHHSQNLKIIKK